ncbi:metallophosphoesterase [Mycobacterium sp. Y57]|uniref:metallophosphoesterase family protein n=1 Tax=Mycolicibacterium xanthum TaxID=2796469 RepID=UPI001C84BA76|nr:metallophosphoesterase [Mycolicibacterium xanthum]MBX7435536.1 metallophosphoesterase [Mycolicibacterium xanthum]
MTDSTMFSIDPDVHPYTHLDFKNDPDEFHFAVLADNSGGPRRGVVAAGLRMLNLLHPEFVVNLGDLVEGYTAPDGTPATEETYREWWREFDGYVEVLEMPFFYLPGNHDLNNPPSVKVWHERFGGEREYYHFRYKDTLFLMVNTEDPPKDTDALLDNDPVQAKMLDDAYKAVKAAVGEGASAAKLLELTEPIESYFGTINISDQQVDYFRRVLADNTDVRWVFVMMHAPAWCSATGEEQEAANFARIEELLADRDYTVFAAHTHTYDYTQRFGRDYITTAMTGAMNVPRRGAIDHVVWVTMTRNGPKIANLLLNGFLDKHGPVEGDHTIEFGMYSPDR